MSKYTEQEDDVQFSEPILAQKGVRLTVQFAEKTEWEEKTKGVKNGVKKDACKLTLLISDSSVKTEHADAKPKLTIEDSFNIETFIYEDKKTGEPKKLGRQKLFELEQAFGFDPVFKVDGQMVEPFITKNGNKVAPKIKDKEVKRLPNPDFFNAYFDENGAPRVDNWVDKVIYADIEVETSEQFGSKNIIKRYVKAPAI